MRITINQLRETVVDDDASPAIIHGSIMLWALVVEGMYPLAMVI